MSFLPNICNKTINTHTHTVHKKAKGMQSDTHKQLKIYKNACCRQYKNAN